ncbi:MAG: hypothetical protein JWN27_2941 [Candidatus Eremiobacteraeota bacterium]|nr:hypothetical protein [Candidatus Eremiobacteraeota bacterium]
MYATLADVPTEVFIAGLARLRGTAAPIYPPFVARKPTLRDRTLAMLGGGGEFTLAQIAEGLDAADSSVKAALSKLQRAGRVKHRSGSGQWSPHLWSVA